jgi:uncharacterized protein YndB with AHSA1/START domain
MSEASHQSITSIDGRELTVNRVINAPRDLVFKAWTDPSHLSEWWGPEGFTITTEKIKVKPGGVWRYVMHGPDGTDYDNLIQYVEVDSPARLVYAHGDSAEEQFRVTASFTDAGAQTELSMKMVFTSIEELEKAVKEFGAIEGAKSTMNRLEALVKKLQEKAS